MPKVRRKTTRKVRRKTAKKRPSSKRARAKKAGKSKTRAKSRSGSWWRLPLKLGIAAMILGVIGLTLTLLAYGSLARGYDLDKLGRMPARSVVFDRNGEVIGKLHGSNRIVVPLRDKPGRIATD